MAPFEEVPLEREEDEEEEEAEDSENEGSDAEGERRMSEAAIRKWDSFVDVPPKQTSGSQTTVEFIDFGVKVLKLLAYIVTFVVVFGGGVAAKTGLLLVTSQLNPTFNFACKEPTRPTTYTFVPPPEEQVLWTWVLFFIICIPELGTFIRSARICFFKNNQFPTLRDFSFVMMMETLHAIGIVLLVFEVLPNLDVVRGAMLTSGVCFIPAVLNLLSRDAGEPYGMLKLIADAAAVLFQFSALIIWPLYEQSARMAWMAPALLFISCGWWINFVPNYLMRGSGPVPVLMRFLTSVKSGIAENTLYWTYFMVSLWKMLVYFSGMISIVAAQGQNLTVFFNTTDAAFKAHPLNGTIVKQLSRNTLVAYEALDFSSGELDWLMVSIVVVAGSYLSYIFAKFACKILIQEVGMSLASILVVPGTIALLAIFNESQTQDVCFAQYFLPPYMFWNLELDEYFIAEKLAWVWIFWLVSQFWVTLHIWFPQCQRLTKTEKLFATPMYSAVVTDQSICLNRTFDDEFDEEEEISENTDKDECVTHVIACATMWHESKDEMLEMLKSIYRLDLDQCAREIAKESYSTSAEAKNNYYKFETQIFFDDAFALEKEGGSDYVINQFVRDLIVCLPEAAREVYRSNRVKIGHPKMFPTPYGGRLEYTLPGGSDLVVHLKDKNKIRHRKRWSQCMYMYYLLGYRLMNTDLDSNIKKKKAKNTFLLALDGDIDFHPKAVLLLVDLMKKNDNLGAACGRIHPVGSGLMAWYQTFEYAIGHWLQKATEHMIGCVLCSPGCFSLFRGLALMDDNVMKTYTKDCEAAADYVQYDQGEDRWLCTLLLQRGYRVEYSAASDAYTHCPENFNEFYNQRRRWVPSTMANIMDLLGSYKRTIEINSNISLLYIIYQTMLLGGTILGPGTIFLMLVGAFVAAFKIDNWTAFYWNLIPILLFIAICLIFNSNIQLMVALIISTAYGLIMMAVLVGILIQIQEDGPLAPSTLFLFVVAGEIMIAGIVHPQEFNCLPSGTIYYVTIPSMYLLLIIYSVCNLNVVSWGTREVAEKKTKEQLEEEAKQAEEEKTNKTSTNSIFSFLGNMAPAKGSMNFSIPGLFRCMFCTQPTDTEESERLINIGKSLASVNQKLEVIERTIVHKIPPSHPSSRRPTVSRQSIHVNSLDEPAAPLAEAKPESYPEEEKKDDRNELFNPYWIEDQFLSKAKGEILPIEETTFWQELIQRYLKPIDANKAKEAKTAAELKDLRDKTVLSFFMLNALFVTVVFLLQLNKDTIFVDWPLGVKNNISYAVDTREITVSQEFLHLEPVGLVFVMFFALILLVQGTGMFLHRFETLCHVLSTTTLRSRPDSEFSVDHVVEGAKKQSFDSKQTVPVSHRNTIKNLEDNMKEKQSSLNIRKSLAIYINKEQEREKEVAEKAERRRSSFGNKLRNSRRMSAAPRMSKRATMVGHSNHGLNSVAEEEE